MPLQVCRHCEVRLASDRAEIESLGLCETCASVRALRRIYKRRRNCDAEREARIMHLRRLAEARQPLKGTFDEPD